MEVRFVPFQYEEPLSRKFLRSIFEKTGQFQRAVLLTTVQHMKQASQVIGYFKEKGKALVFGGQVLGCNVSSARGTDADAFVFLGTGDFHALGIANETGKSVLVANPFSGKVDFLDERQVRKHALLKHKFLSEFEDASEIGLLVSLKQGQYNLKKAMDFSARIKKIGKNPHIFLFNTLVPEELVNFPGIDFWVNFACPRIQDDYKRFSRPVLNYKEFKD